MAMTILIYLLSCKVCGLQYVGSTTEKCRFHWNNYKENERKALRGKEQIQPEIYTFFPGRSLVNVKYILLNYTYVFCSEFYFCILDRSIFLFG